MAEEITQGGGEASGVSTDLSERTSLSQAASAVSARFGEPDILVNCAGVPGDFAGVAVFPGSGASDFVTGQTIRVDGGFSVA